MQVNDPTLIAVSSPFQCICALEAISEFSIHNYKFCVVCNEGKRKSQIQSLLEKYGVKAFYIPSPNYLFFILRYIFRGRVFDCKYKFGICGDFKNINMQLFLVKHLLRRGKIMYLDDGFTSIYPLNNIRYKDKKILLRNISYLIYKELKRISDNYFFTIFKSSTNKYIIFKNYMHILQLPSETSQKGVYILGTVVQFADSILSNYKFIDYFKAVIVRAHSEFPAEPIFYSPHSRSIETDGINEICIEYGVEILPSNFPVEIEYAEKGYNPSVIIGFGSTALISLSKIFCNAKVINILLPTNNILYSNKNIFVNRYLERESIPTISIL